MITPATDVSPESEARPEEDPRVALAKLNPRAAFAPSLPIASGGLISGLMALVFSCVVLALGLTRSIPDGDSAHQLAELLRDGTRAPGESALWGWLARQFESLPFGPSSAWRIALLSALSAAASAGLLAIWLRRRDIGRRAAIVAALLFAFSLPVWQSAVVPGSAPLVTAIALAALVLLEEGLASRRPGPRRLGWALVGVGMTQGPVAVGAMIAVVALEVLPRGADRQLRPSSFLAFLIGGGLGLIGGGALPALSAMPWDPIAPADGIAQVALLAGPLAVVALLGVLVLWLKHPGDAGAWTMLATLPLAAALIIGPAGGARLDPASFPAAVPLTFAALAALAAAAIDALLQRFAATPSPRTHALTALAAAVPLGAIVWGAPIADRSDWRYGEDWARSVLQSLPPDALIFSGSDSRGGLLEWAQLIDGVRPEVVVADPGGQIDPRRSPLLAIEPVPPSTAGAIDAVRARTERPVFALTPIPTTEGRWSPWGIVWRWGPQLEAPAAEEKTAWEAVRIRGLPTDPAGARAWIGGESGTDVQDRTARRIAADYYQARARRDGMLSQVGPWATVLDRLAELRATSARRPVTP